MTLTQKEASLIKDLQSKEQLCVEKYTRFANDAKDGQLKNLFTQIAQVEQQHLQTIDQIASGTVPQVGGSGGMQPTGTFTPAENYSQADRQSDCYLCQDALENEKHVSSVYDTSIFEFCDVGVRNALNHIQKEEQEHGEKIFKFMSTNGMYQVN